MLNIPGVTPSNPEKFFRLCLIILGGDEFPLRSNGDFPGRPEESLRRNKGIGSASSSSSETLAPNISSLDPTVSDDTKPVRIHENSIIVQVCDLGLPSRINLLILKSDFKITYITYQEY